MSVEPPKGQYAFDACCVKSTAFLAKLETAISELPLILVPSADAVSALIVSVRHPFRLVAFSLHGY